MHSPTVQLPSGGSIVIHTDRGADRDRRQFRPLDARAAHRRDGAQDQPRGRRRGRPPAAPARPRRPDRDRLHRHGASSATSAPVERRLRDALKIDRARLQIGKISQFGLLELSRQRLRPSLQELSSQACPICQGLGVVRSTECCALQALRRDPGGRHPRRGREHARARAGRGRALPAEPEARRADPARAALRDGGVRGGRFGAHVAGCSISTS